MTDAPCSDCGTALGEVRWSEQYSAELCGRCRDLRSPGGSGEPSPAVPPNSNGKPLDPLSEVALRNDDEQSATETTWTPVPLGPVLAGDAVIEPPAMLARVDGKCLLYGGRLHLVYGEPEAGKGMLALAAAAERLRAGEHVLYIDLEDEAATAVERLLALEVDRELIETGFHYVRPEEPLGERGWHGLQMALAHRPTLCVIDAVTEAMTLHGFSINDNEDYAKFLETLPRPLQRTGAAVVLIDHVQKSREARGRFAIGAQHKLAGADVAYSLEAREPFARGVDGHVVIKVRKDRPGHVRRHAVNDRVALMQVRSLDGGERLRIELEPPGEIDDDFRPTALMEKISEAVEQTPGLSKTAIRAAVNGKHGAKDEALQLLVSERYIRVEKSGSTHCHYSIRPYRRADDPEDKGTAR